ncbi:MAG: fibronectin type III-like domain-contianing protein, partial [Muriicola sp.]
LKGFEKVHVKKGETSTVTLALPVKELAYYDIEKSKWVIEPGNYDLRLGNSSRAINTVVSVAIGTE